MSAPLISTVSMDVCATYQHCKHGCQHCFSVLSAFHFILVTGKYWFNPRRPVPTWFKIDDWDVKNQTKHTNKNCIHLCLNDLSARSYIIGITCTSSVVVSERVISINTLFAYCKGGNFNIHIWAWFGYFIC